MGKINDLDMSKWKELTDVWQENGITEGKEYAILTNEIYKEWSGMTAKEYKQYKCSASACRNAAYIRSVPERRRKSDMDRYVCDNEFPFKISQLCLQRRERRI